MKQSTVITLVSAVALPQSAAWDYYEPHVALEWPNSLSNPFIVQDPTSFPCGRAPLQPEQRILSRFPISGAPFEIGFFGGAANTSSTSHFTGQLSVGLWNQDLLTTGNKFVPLEYDEWQNFSSKTDPWCSTPLDVRGLAKRILGRTVSDGELEGMNATFQFTSSKLEDDKVVRTEYQVFYAFTLLLSTNGTHVLITIHSAPTSSSHRLSSNHFSVKEAASEILRNRTARTP
jgi:hypothetical protein